MMCKGITYADILQITRQAEGDDESRGLVGRSRRRSGRRVFFSFGLQCDGVRRLRSQ